MKRFFRKLLVVDGSIGVVLAGFGIWQGWTAEGFMVAFMVVSALALFGTGATMGRVARTASVGPGGGMVGRAMAQAATGEQTIAAYEADAKADRRNPARRRAAPGGKSLGGELFLIMLTTAVVSAAASLAAWKVSG